MKTGPTPDDKDDNDDDHNDDGDGDDNGDYKSNNDEAYVWRAAGT